jgi:hypothetical protein
MSALRRDGLVNVTATRGKLLSAIAKGRRWLDEIISGKVEGIEAIAAREGVSERSARMGLSLAFLAPDIVQALQPESGYSERLKIV